MSMRVISLLTAFAVLFVWAHGTKKETSAEKLLEETETLTEKLKDSLEDNRDATVSSYGTCSGRLTVQSTVAIPVTDQTAKGTIYFTPFNGNLISIYDGTKWRLFNFSEISLALTMTSGSNYDVYAYNNAGTVALELSSAWSSDTARGVGAALTTLNGILVKNTDNTRRYLGTLRASGTDVTEDSISKRYVWNHYNRRKRLLKVIDTTDTWSYSTTTWRSANNSATNRVEYVAGQDDPLVHAFVLASARDSDIAFAYGVGVDSTSANSASLTGSITPNSSSFGKVGAAHYDGQPGLGYHYLQWLEIVSAALTMLGDGGQTVWQGGLVGTVEG